MTITDINTNETVQVRGKAHDTDIPVSTAFTKLATRLSDDESSIKILPLLKYKGTQKVVMKLTPNKIQFRRYYEEGFDEEIF